MSIKKLSKADDQIVTAIREAIRQEVADAVAEGLKLAMAEIKTNEVNKSVERGLSQLLQSDLEESFA